MVIDERPLAVPSLLARVGAGDAGAVREVLSRYGGLVWSIAKRFEPSEAEDAVQEIFLDLWKSAGRYDAALGSEATFIATIARRRLIDRRRTRRRRPQDTGQVAEVVLEEVASDGTSPADLGRGREGRRTRSTSCGPNSAKCSFSRRAMACRTAKSRSKPACRSAPSRPTPAAV